MDLPQGETWRFTIDAGPADQVYLAVDGPTLTGRWIQMQPVDSTPGSWTVEMTILPGRHRLRYFTVDNGTTLNCGSDGIKGQRVSRPHPAVIIDDLVALAASA